MYKILNITDKSGNVKKEFIKELKEVHPDMVGQILYPIAQNLLGMIRMCFLWMDDSDKMLRTSIVEDYEVDSNLIIVTTKNSIYTLERI